MKSSQPKIGLWGWHNSGKTAYLVALYRYVAIQKQAWRMYPTDVASERFIERYACKFLPDRCLPDQTDALEVKNYEFLMVKNSGRWNQGEYRLTLIDAQGKYIGDPTDPIGYFGALQNCHGLICLIDPKFDKSDGVHRPISYGDSEQPQSYLELFERLFRKIALAGLDEHRCLRTNIAFCISKIDLDDHWNYRQKKIAEHCRSIIGSQAFQLIENHCAPQRHQFFAVSAVGRYAAPIVSPSTRQQTVERSNLEPAGDEFRIADVEKWVPFGLLEPLEWLFGRIEQDRAAGNGFVDFLRSGLRA